MGTTNVRTMNAAEVLRSDHRKLRQLLLKYLEVVPEKSDGKKGRLFEAIQKALTIHATIEEELFFPAFEEESRKNGRVRRILSKAVERDRQLRILLHELLSMEPRDGDFDAKVRVLGERVGVHIDEQEEFMHPIFSELPQKRQDEVSSDLQFRRMELEGEFDLG